MEEVQKVSDRKQNLVNDLEVLNQSWQDFLRAQKAEFTLEGIRKAILALEQAEPQGLPALWEKLGELSQTCQRQNTINGAVVILRQQVTNQALDILRGQSMGGSTYDNKGGKKPSGGVGHTIAKA
jgi:flagellar biosynthesis/type III secretory pathway chaperone